MAARKYAYDDNASLEACLHDQSRSSRPSGMPSATATHSGVAPINRTSGAPPPSIPRAATIPEFTAAERTSAFELHAAPRSWSMVGVVGAAAMFLLMTVVASFVYYH